MPRPRFGSRSSSDQDPRERELPRRKPENDEEIEEDEEEKTDLKGYLLSLARDIFIAIIVMVIIIGSLWWYTGNWPPMVVIESNSMMHGEDSSVGVIDTGDLVLVKEISGRGDIKTYMEGKKSGYETYGSYGDVIIFRKNGLDETPVIHRAVIWLEYNASGHHYDKDRNYLNGSFDVPAMPENRRYDQSGKIYINNYKPRPANLTIDLGQILANFERFGRTPHSGFITKGDHNDGIDQTSSLIDVKGRSVEPINTSWIVGKAQGELPWFGLIKLFIGGETDEPGKGAPPTSVNMLILSIVLIVVIPIILDLTFSYLGKRKKQRQEEEEEEPGGQDDARRPGPGSGPSTYTFQPRARGSEKMGQKPKDQQSTREPSDLGRDQQRDYVSKDDLFKKIK